MAELTEEERQAQELKHIKDNSPFALPDDPSSSGWPTAQIKEKHWLALVILYGYIVAERKRITDLITGDNATALGKIAGILEGSLIVEKAKKDQNGDVIDTTYAKISKILDGTIAALKYIKADGTKGDIKDILAQVESNADNLATWIQTYFTDNAANEALHALAADRSTKDENGNIIHSTYATTAVISLLQTAITNITNGNTTVMKAYKDQYGNIIDLVYAKLTDLATLLTQVGFTVSGDNAVITYKSKNGTVNSVTVPLATGTNAGLMSPSDVAQIATLVAKVSAFEELTRRLSYTTKSNPTKAEILAFVQENGYTDERQYYGIKVVVSATNHVWIWYDNLDEFADVGVETVSQATQSSLGTVKGSNVRGKGYIEHDGTISFVGYDQLNNNVAPPYSNQVTYEVGDVRIYEGVLYQCNTTISTAEAFNSSKWDIVNLKSLLDLKFNKAGGTFTGNITTQNIFPDATANNRMLGSSEAMFSNVYAYRLICGNSKFEVGINSGKVNVGGDDYFTVTRASGNTAMVIGKGGYTYSPTFRLDTKARPTIRVYSDVNVYEDYSVAYLSDLNSKQDTLTFDNAPTANSNNPVKSSGIYTALAGKQNDLGLSIVDGKICMTY